mmetsp:Transcript_102855/g.160465  ORF Transcript_102855/g.160465 Transcript_102855/m.160465 type:complete len:142 (+) Transcript_102855:10-435(+)
MSQISTLPEGLRVAIDKALETGRTKDEIIAAIDPRFRAATQSYLGMGMPSPAPQQASVLAPSSLSSSALPSSSSPPMPSHMMGAPPSSSTSLPPTTTQPSVDRDAASNFSNAASYLQSSVGFFAMEPDKPALGKKSERGAS